MKGVGRSIRLKLLAIILLTTTSTLVAAFAFVLYSDFREFRRDMVEGMAVIARVTAENTVAELAFGDREEAAKTLAHLALTPGIISARLYDARGALFSAYESEKGRAPSVGPVAGVRQFLGARLHVTESVDYQGEHYGTIEIVASTNALRAKLRQHLVVMLSFMLVLLIASTIVAMFLGRLISGPILQLAAVARTISQKHDYTLRVVKKSDDEVGVLSDGFNDMLAQIERRQRERDEADQRTREKSQFLANMSHELRTPLNAIIGFSEILRERLASRLDERENRFLDNIHSSGEHLLGIVNDVLDLAKVEAGRMEVHPEPFSLEHSIDGVVHLMRGVSTRKRVSFALDIPRPLPALHADPVKVKQVLYNLLSNAVKFSPDGAVVTIGARELSAAVSPLRAESIELSVSDPGIGIDPQHHDLIFKEFQQIDDGTARQFEGTGLGLALVRKFVELHRGRIALRSALGSGSTFTVTLPLQFQGVETPISFTNAEALAEEPGVLIIDADETAFRRADAALTAAGYRAFWARSGEEGMELARTLRPAAIAIDPILPGVDGWRLVKALKSSSTTGTIPLILLTSSSASETQNLSDADVCLPKPLDGDRLVKSVAELTRRRRAAVPLDVLLVDRDQDVHDIIDEHLANGGYRVAHSFDVEEAFRRASTEQPGIVIVDLMMEQMQGLDFALRLRNDPRTSRLPILALTSDELSSADSQRLNDQLSAIVDRSDLHSLRLSSVIEGLVHRRGFGAAGAPS